MFLWTRHLPWLLAPGVIILLVAAVCALCNVQRSPWLRLTVAEQVRLGGFFTLAMLALPSSFQYFAVDFGGTMSWLFTAHSLHQNCQIDSCESLSTRLAVVTLIYLPLTLYLTAFAFSFRAFYYRPLTLVRRWVLSPPNLYTAGIAMLVAASLIDDLATRYYYCALSTACTCMP